jgi:uncharacterized protein YraI
MKLPGFLIAALLLTAPTAALAARGIVTDSVSLRAGPGTGFPVVDRIPGGAHVNIHGCLRGDAWCDVSWAGDRGWVSSEYLQYYYRNRYVYLPDYVDEVDVPVVPFVLGSYWASYYASRPFYHRRAHWADYWRSHARFATRLPNGGSRGRVATEARGAAFANERGERRGLRENMQRGRIEQGRTARINERSGVNRRGEFAGTRQPFARPHERARFSAGPNNVGVQRPNAGRVGAAPFQGQRGGEPRAMARPMPQGGPGAGPGTVGRGGGAPIQSRAQMGAPHAPAPAPHAMGGGAPRAAAPAGGGGGAAMAGPRGGGHGRPR